MENGIPFGSYADRVGGKSSEKVRTTQRTVLSPLLFLAYVNNIWKNTVTTIILFADDCVI